MSLFVKDNASDLMHQPYVSVFAWRGEEAGLLDCHSPLNIFQSSIHYAFDEGLSGWTISEAVKALRKKTKQKKTKKTIYALQGRSGVVAECKG